MEVILRLGIQMTLKGENYYFTSRGGGILTVKVFLFNAAIENVLIKIIL